jgi:hypothetical protein
MVGMFLEVLKAFAAVRTQLPLTEEGGVAGFFREFEWT